jgi:hypothetical protein
MAKVKYVARAQISGLERPVKGAPHVLNIGEEIELDPEHSETVRLVKMGALAVKPADEAPEGE